MKCIQVTDLHVGLPSEKPHDVDVRANFLRVLEAVAAEEADQIVFSGDLCYRQPDASVYDWILGKCRAAGINPLVISGNHDEQAILKDYFDAGYHEDSGEIYFLRSWVGSQVFFLDTTPGSMSETQLDWLEATLDASHAPIIFMHHPPALCGVPHMDNKYNFKQIDRVQKLFHGHPHPVHVFCGHYHVNKTVSVSNLHIHITPSCFFQIRSDIQEFGIDHYRIGYRRIIIEEGRLIHEVVWL
jgi:Icc protein